MDSSYCHLSYWLPHVITYMLTFQIHFMFMPHACGLLGVSNMLYSQCCGMVVWKLNCSYRCQWNGALHYGHLLFATIKVIKDYGWYMCWQMPKSYPPSSLNGEQQIRHSFPFCVKGWSLGHKSFFIFSNTTVTYSKSSSRCVAQSMHLLSYIYSKLSRNISDIFGHDVKLCDWNLSSSWYFVCILTSFIFIYVTWDAAKIHANCMLLKFH
jgi:hypothetical protein